MATREGVRQYLIAGIVILVTVWFFYQYAAVRYGVAGLSSLNKSLAMSTLVLLGTVLLLGPLARMFAFFDRSLKYRKELGVLTFFTGLVHVYLSIFPLGRGGPFGLFLARPLSAYSGLFGLVIMFFLLLFSIKAVGQMLGPKLWWKMQNWGARLAFILIAFHMTVLKYAGWGPWFATRGAEITEGVPSLPPLAILGAVFTVFVLLVRFSEFLGPRLSRSITQLSFLATAAFTIWLFV